MQSFQQITHSITAQCLTWNRCSSQFDGLRLNLDMGTRLISEYVRYYHRDRTHLGLAKEAPAYRIAAPLRFRIVPVLHSLKCS